MGILLSYNGSTILSTSATGINVLKTAGKYCSGNFQIQYISNTGSNFENSIINGSLSGSYYNDRVTNIGAYAFMYMLSPFSAIECPNCTTIGYYAFFMCANLVTASFPKCISLASFAFDTCYNLTTVNLLSCAYIGSRAFGWCSSLATISLPSCSIIGQLAFNACTRLKSVYLTGSSVAALSHSNAFSSTPIGGYSATAGTFGSIYVPASLLSSYKAATNWTYYSSRFVGI